MKSKEKRSGDVGCCEVDNSGLATVFPTMTNHFYLKYDIAGLSGSGLSEKSIVSLQAVRSAKTLAAYEADWNDFCGWCRYHGAEAFPAVPATIVNYINDLANYAKVSTIKRRIHAISANYRAACVLGLLIENPCCTWIVKKSLRGLFKRKGYYLKGKMPIRWEELEQMVCSMDLTTKTGLRDRAILLLGFMGALRRSELAALRVEDIHRHPLGIVIDVPISHGKRIGIPDLTRNLENSEMDCILSMRAWVWAGGFRSGPLMEAIACGMDLLNMRQKEE